MFAAAALMALAAPSADLPAAQVQVRARAVAAVTILAAAEVRDGQVAQHHQRRRGSSPDGTAFTLIEFE